MLEIAKITSKGQITIPVAVRKRLRVSAGDKLVFAEENGRVVLENSSALALRNIQREMSGEAERAGITSEKDAAALVDEARQEIWDERYANSV